MVHTKDRKVKLSFSQNWILEVETIIQDNNGHIVAQIPIMIPGVEIVIDVTDLMTQEQCTELAERISNKIKEISVRQLQTGRFFTRESLIRPPHRPVGERD